jgi:hypothetical protein
MCSTSRCVYERYFAYYAVEAQSDKASLKAAKFYKQAKMKEKKVSISYYFYNSLKFQ